MASEHFWYNPTTGNGSTQVSVSADTMNGGTADRLSTITFTAGSASKTVSVRQKYMPYKQQFASQTFPATGGTIYFTVHTEYDVVFRSVPEWITISYNGTTIQEGQLLTPSQADNKTFALTADENTGETRSVGSTMSMAHYVDGVQQHYVSYFSFTQEGPGGIKDIRLSPIYIEVSSAATSATVNMIVENCTFDHFTTSTAGTFTITAASPVNNVITLTFPATYASGETRGYLSFYLYDTDNHAYSSTVTVVRAASSNPRDIQLSPSAVTVEDTSTGYRIYIAATNCTVTGMTYVNNNPSFPVTAVREGNYIQLTYAANTGSQRVTNITFTLRDQDNNEYRRPFILTQEEQAVVETWTIANNTSFNIYGTIYTTSGDLNMEMLAGEEDIRTEITPVYITGFALVASPMPSFPENIDLSLGNTNTGQRIYGYYNGSAWIANGDITVYNDDQLSLDRR